MLEFLSQHATEAILGLVSSGAITGWLFERKKKKAQDQIIQASALEQMQSAYDRYVEDDKKRYADLKAQVEDLQKKLHDVEEYWKKKYTTLKSEFNKYKRENGDSKSTK